MWNLPSPCFSPSGSRALDALTVVVNPKNDWVDHLTVEELNTMWVPAVQDKVNNWSQVRAGFPDRPLKL